MVFEPPCTERYARWCERSVGKLITYLLLDFLKEKQLIFFMLTERMKPSIIVLNISAEMHKQAAICALQNNISLNKIVEQALQRFLMLEN